MPHFRAHQCAPPFPALQRVSPLMSHVSKLTNGLLSHPPLLLVSPRLQCATFLSSPTRSSLFLPSSECFLVSDLLSFHANQLLPLSSPHQLSPSLLLPTLLSTPTHSFLSSALCFFLILLPPPPPPHFFPLPSLLPSFQAHQSPSPPSSPPVGESSFMTYHVSKLTNLLLPFPPLQQVSPHL